MSALRHEVSLLCDRHGRVTWVDDSAARLLDLQPGDTLASRTVGESEGKLARLLVAAGDGPVEDRELCLLVEGAPRAVLCSLFDYPGQRLLLVGSLVPEQYSQMVSQVDEAVAELGALQRQSDRQQRELQQRHDDLVRLHLELDDSGLGLALSRRLSTILGGTLVVARSAPGAGTTFELRIPRVHPEVTEMAAMQERSRAIDPRRAPIEWQRTFDAIAESAAILRADGTILRTNRALLALVRASAEEIAGHRVRDVFRQRLGVDDPILALPAEDLDRHTSEIRAGDCWYRVVTDPILDEQGVAQRYVLVMTDITSLRGLADAERRRADELLEDNRRKDEFLAMLAHELRNPLNAIATATALQERGIDDEHLSVVRATVARQVRQLSRLVDDLLDVSRLTRGRVQLQKDSLDLSSVVHEVVQMARPYLEASRQPLILDLPDAPVPVNGDSLRLGQALANLLSNASKFSDVGRRILLRCEIDREDEAHPVATIRVVDEGIGIDPARLESIFEPFVQGQTTLARSEGGLGIGLTIAKRMIELHEGQLTAHSAGLGAGTEFRVTMPLAPERPAKPAQPTALDGYLRDYRPPALLDVLIVEDDEDAAELMRALFSAVGHRTRVARDGIAGLAEVLSTPPDVAFIDIGLPRMDGYEVARTIRRSDQGGAVYLVALTGYGRPEDRARALAAGFDVHLVKPLEIHRVHELMERRSVRGPMPDDTAPGTH